MIFTRDKEILLFDRYRILNIYIGINNLKSSLIQIQDKKSFVLFKTKTKISAIIATY